MIAYCMLLWVSQQVRITSNRARRRLRDNNLFVVALDLNINIENEDGEDPGDDDAVML